MDVTVWLLPLILGMVNSQGECLPLDVGPALLVIPSASTDPSRLQSKLTAVFLDHQVHVCVTIDLPGFDGMADFRRNGAEQFIHGLGYWEPFGQQPGHPIPMETHLEMPNHGSRDPAFMELARGQPGGQPCVQIEESNFYLMLSSQVPIHVADLVASFSRVA